MAKTKNTPKHVEELSYEEALAELEGIVEALEEDGSRHPLEESIRMFERGQSLAAHCTALLESAQLKIQTLSGEETLMIEEDSE